MTYLLGSFFDGRKHMTIKMHETPQGMTTGTELEKSRSALFVNLVYLILET